MPKQRNEIKDLKQFGSALAAILLVFGVINFLKGRIGFYPWFFGLSVVTILLVLVAPKCIKPIFIVFSKIGHAIGWVNSRIILALIYSIFVTPIAIVMKVIGRDPLNRKIDKKETSHWIKHATVKATKENLEKQF